MGDLSLWKKTEAMVLVGSENRWAEHSWFGTAHGSPLKIQPRRDRSPE